MSASVKIASPAAGPLVINSAEHANEVLRNRAFRLPEIAPYLQQLQDASGRDYSGLIGVAQSSLIFQSEADHLKSRGVIARFFREANLRAWEPQIDRAIRQGLDHLATVADPDLVRDFTDPLFVALVQRIMGLTISDPVAFVDHVNTARQITEPLLSLRQITGLQDAFAAVMATVPNPDPIPAPDGTAANPVPLPQALYRDARDLPAHIDLKALVATLSVACHTLAESLAHVLWGVLQGPAAQWQALADPQVTADRLADLLARYASTLNLFRQAGEKASLAGCPVDHGRLVALDMPSIRRLETGAPADLSFGVGPHRCPGAALSELVLLRVLPALSARFPNLRVQVDGVRFHQTQIIRAPVVLPCSGIHPVRRVHARMIDVGRRDVARMIVSDDSAFGPPAMESHLAALEQASGKDLSIARLFARNAMFFMTGPRHQNLRYAVSAVLGANRLTPWQPLLDHVVQRALDRMAATPQCDVMADYCMPLLQDVCMPILGLVPSDPARFHQTAPELQKVLKPLLSLRAIETLQGSLKTLLDQCRQAEAPAGSVLAALRQDPGQDVTDDDALAVVMVLYGASFNMAYGLGNALFDLLRDPQDRQAQISTQAGMCRHLDKAIVPGAAAPKYIYRQARHRVTVGDVHFDAGDTARIVLADVNPRGEGGHLAFGHGLHHCVGASLSRMIWSTAIPAFFTRFPQARLVQPVPSYQDNSQTVALASLPCSVSLAQG